MPVDHSSDRPPFPIPADFPVTWEQPGDAERHWRFGQSHWGTQMTVFDFTIDGAIVWAGSDLARRHYGMAPSGQLVRRINTYYYLSTSPPILSLEERERIARETDARIEAAIATYRRTWEDEWLPELRRHHAWWEAFDLAGASDEALVEHARASWERMARLWQLHFLILTPGYAAVALFGALYDELFGETPPLEVQRLLQGFDNKTIATGRALWQVAQAAERHPEVAAMLTSVDPRDAPARLRETAEGRAVLAELDAAIALYGQRYENWLPSNPSWIEDPTPAIASLRDMIGRPEADPDRRLAGLAAEREQLVAAARARLADRPAETRARFELLLAAAQLGVILTEDHGFWIDTRGTYKVRRVMVEIGRRLTERGWLSSKDDVFHLWPEEAIGALESGVDRGLGDLVAQRRAEIARFASVRPPLELGRPAPPAPPPLDAVGRATARMRAPAPPSAEPDLLRGIGASAGLRRGTVRIVRRLADATRLAPGDILVTGSTSPAWTPLFAALGAVITEVGGMLGHCGIVAREYRIPAVVGIAGAMSRLVDGQTVEVDGAAGTVRPIAGA